MITRRYALVLAVTSLVAACAPPAAAPVDTTAADTAAIEAVRQLEVSGLASGDSSMAYVSDDVLMMPPNEPAISGIAAARAWGAAFMRQFKATVAYSNTNLEISGDMAVETYSGTLTLTPVAGGAAMTEVLKGIHVYHRNAAGAWKMTMDIWNSDTPLPAAK